MRSATMGYAGQLIAAVAGLAMLLGHAAVIGVRRALRGDFSDFRAFYFAAGAMLRHADPYAPQHRNYIYPPLIAFLYAPLALLPQRHAAVVVLCANVLILAAALAVAARECLRRLDGPTDPRAVACVALLAVLMLPDKVRGELQMFQTNALMLLAFALALRWVDRRPTWAGAALGFACNIKYLPLVMLPYLLVRRRWSAAVALVVAAVAFGLLPAVLSGWDANLRHLSIAFGGLQRMVGADTAGAETALIGDVKAGFSLSVTSAVARAAHRWGGDAWILPVVAAIGGILLAAAVVIYRRNGLTFFASPGAAGRAAQPYRGAVALEWAGMVAVALAFSPQTNSRHLVLLLLVATPIAVMLLVPRRGVSRLPLAAAAALLLFGLTFPWGGTQTALAVRARAWFTFAGQSWCALAAYGLLAWTGLTYLQAAARGEPAYGPFAPGERDLTEQRLRAGWALIGR